MFKISDDQLIEIGKIESGQSEYAITICREAEFEKAGEFLKRIKSDFKTIEAIRKDVVSPIDEAKKEAQEFFKPLLNRLADAEAKIKNAMAGFLDSQRLAAEKERQKAIVAAIEAEERQRAKIQAQAQKAADLGKIEKAEALGLLAESVSIAAIIPESNIAKVEGVHERSVWGFEIVDPSKIPLQFLIVDEKKIGKYVSAMRECGEIPGVKIFKKTVLAVRS